MAQYQVTYTRRNDRVFGYESISHLGGPGWEHPINSVITSIVFGGMTYETYGGGSAAEVRPWPDILGPFVRTVANGLWADNLLALPIR